MSRILLAALSFLLLGVAGGALWLGETDHAGSRSLAQNEHADAVHLNLSALPDGKNIVLTLPDGRRLTLALSGAALQRAALCRSGEKLCRVASYITWCCRADQQCDTSTIGGCQ